jgi:hypothetical protein
MYSVLGVDLFCFLAHQEGINEQRNFKHLGNAALLLFQCLTNDAWSGLMADAMLDETSGLCSDEAGSCGSWVAVPYFISFQIIGSFVLLNLIVVRQPLSTPRPLGLRVALPSCRVPSCRVLSARMMDTRAHRPLS